MLSPGRFHERVPRDFDKNRAYRKDVLQAARNAPAMQAVLVERCRQDILYYINTFVYEFNPRHKGHEEGPFICWPFQEEYIFWRLDHIERDRDTVTEKSREVGVTWMSLIIHDWLAQFKRRQKFLAISHTEDAVDRRDDPDSMFWKIDFMHEHLPSWMPGAKAKHLDLRFSFPDSKSFIAGTATTKRTGVGGRATEVLCDEFGRQQNDRDILGQTADTGCRSFVSTHYGTGTAFFELTRRPDMDKFVIHWSQHPEKRRGLYRFNQQTQRVEVLDPAYRFAPDYRFVLDGSPTGGPFPGLRSPWYDAECLRRASPRDVAMHLDVDPQGSQSQYFEPAGIRQLIGEWAREPDWQGDVHFDRDTGKPVALVEAPGGPLSLWCRLRNNRPEPGVYVIGGDISQGTGATPSVLVGGNAKLGEQVFEYCHAHKDPKQFALVAVALCHLFADEYGEGAKLIWEQQGPGINFGDKVIELGYGNIYYRTADRPHTMKVKISDRPGWVPTPESIDETLGTYRSDLATRSWIIHSEQQLLECLDFRYGERGQVVHAKALSPGDPSGARVNHGDRVVASALCLKLVRARGIMRTPESEEDEPADGPLSFAWRRQQAEQQARKSRWA